MKTKLRGSSQSVVGATTKKRGGVRTRLVRICKPTGVH